VSEHAPVSPCVGVCVLDPVTQLCRGCGRSIDEIARWPGLSAEEKRRIIGELRGREPHPQGRHAGTGRTPR